LQKTKKKNKKLRTFMICLVLVLLLYNLFTAYVVMIRTLRSVAQSQMEEVASCAIHKAIDETSPEGGYGNLINIHHADDGTIVSVTLNSEAANRYKSRIALLVLKELNKSENYTISVPLGNFCGSEFLSGLGPEIKFKIIPCNIAHIDFESKFTPAGINQVIHTLSVRVNVNIGALLPGFEEISDLTSSAIISETVIMGNVPETYLNIQK